MSSSDQNKQRNRKIAENEADRQVVGDIRVSVWAIAVTVVVGVIVFGLPADKDALGSGGWVREFRNRGFRPMTSSRA